MPEVNDINTKKNEEQKKLQNFYENQNCDILLHVEDKQFSIDKETLMKFSPKCATNLREGGNNEIVIPGLKPEAVRWVLNYMQNENISIDEDNAWSILEAASYFQISSIEKKCFDFLERALTIDNCIEAWEKLNTLTYESLLLAVRRFIIIEFTRVMKTEGFLNLTDQQLKRFQKEFESDIEENVVLKSILQWVNFNESKRRNMMTSMIKRFSSNNVSKDILKTIKEQNLLHEDRDANEWMIDAFYNKICNHNINFLFILDRCDNKCYIYNISTNRLRLLPQDIQIGWSNLICYNGTIYSVGGYIHSNLIKLLYPFDLSKQKWSLDGIELNIEISSPAVAVLNDKLYIISGSGPDGTVVNECVVYDFIKQTMSPISPLSESRSECAAAVHGGSIYVCGGLHDEDFIFQRFDPRENTWEKMPSEGPSLSQCSATLINDYLYCSNMYPHTRNIIYKFDMRARNWQEVPTDDRILNGNNYITSNGCHLYEAGDRGLYKLDTTTNSWTLLLDYEFSYPICIYVK